MTTFKAYAGVARAPFLMLPVTLVAAGAAAGFYSGAFSWLNTLLALVGLVALHMAVNIFNECSDMRTEIDLNTEPTPFSGGSGTLPRGEMTPRAAFTFGVAMSAVGCAVGAWFLILFGTALVPVIVLGAVCVLAYTDLLARMGVGEIAAGLGLGGLAVIGTAMVQDGSLGAAAVAASIPATFMTFNLLLLNEFPDESADRAGGRRNLVILLGRRWAALVYAAAGLATPAAVVVAVALGFLPMLCLCAALPSVLLAKPLQWAFSDPRQPVPIPAMGSNVIWNLATNSVMAITLVVA